MSAWRLIMDGGCWAEIWSELLCTLGYLSSSQDLVSFLDISQISLSVTAWSPGETKGNYLPFLHHIAKPTHSCQFLFYNIRRIRTILSTEATRVLLQSLDLDLQTWTTGTLPLPLHFSENWWLPTELKMDQHLNHTPLRTAASANDEVQRAQAHPLQHALQSIRGY